MSGKPEPLFFFFFFVPHPFTVTSSGSYRHIERYVLTKRKATTSFVCPPSLRPSLSGVAHRHSLTHTLGRCGGSESKPPCLGGLEPARLLFTWRLAALRRVRDFEIAVPFLHLRQHNLPVLSLSLPTTTFLPQKAALAWYALLCCQVSLFPPLVLLFLCKAR